jgi:hypothetical protein
MVNINIAVIVDPTLCNTVNSNISEEPTAYIFRVEGASATWVWRIVIVLKECRQEVPPKYWQAMYQRNHRQIPKDLNLGRDSSSLAQIKWKCACSSFEITCVSRTFVYVRWYCIAALRTIKVTDSANLTGERVDGERPTGGWLAGCLPYVRGTALQSVHSGVTEQRSSQCVTEGLCTDYT